jgi:hypothetical protein
MNLRCFIFGHVWRLRWYSASPYRWRPNRRGVEARCECLRCGKILTDFSTPPRQAK